MHNSKSGLIGVLSSIFKHVSKKSKIRLLFIIVLSIFSALSEVLTLGSIIPFLSILLDVNAAQNNSLVQSLLLFIKYFGLNNDNVVINVSILFITFVVISTILRILLVILYTHWTYALGIEIAGVLYHKSITQPYHTYSKQNSSNILGLLSTKLETFTGEVFVSIPQLIAGLIIALAITGSILLITPVIALITFLIFGVSYLFIQLIYNKTVFHNSYKIAFLQNSIIKLIQESLGSIKNIILDKTQSFNHNFFYDNIKKLRMAQFENAYISQYPKFLLEGVAILLITILAIYWSINYGNTVEFIPELAVLALGGQKLLPIFQLIYHAFNRLITNREALIETAEVLARPSVLQMNNVSKLEFKNFLEIKNLKFKYESSETIFENLNLEILPSSVIGIFGKSGIGKTTLFEVLMLLLKPDKGKIIVDNIEIKDSNIDGWHSIIAHVPQNVFIYDDTIRNNIVNYSMGGALDEARYKDAIIQSELGKFIDSLPNGDSTIVGERGAKISGGQKQRIGIARALYKDAQIFFFDEITSSLDQETEKNIIDSIKKINQLGKTVLMISHKLSVLDICDSIYEFENKKITKIK
tara:strand:+ start:765 stop:2516 length:1752 start_codon:yes stop_codon:yes gene_type:complete